MMSQQNSTLGRCLQAQEEAEDPETAKVSSGNLGGGANFLQTWVQFKPLQSIPL